MLSSSDNSSSTTTLVASPSPMLLSTTSLVASQQSPSPLSVQKMRFSLQNEKRKISINDVTKNFNNLNIETLSNKGDNFNKVNDIKNDNNTTVLIINKDYNKKSNQLTAELAAKSSNEQRITSLFSEQSADENKNNLISKNLNNLNINVNNEHSNNHFIEKNNCKPLAEQVNNNDTLFENNKDCNQWSIPPSPPSHPPPSSSADSAEDEEDITIFSMSSDLMNASGIKMISKEYYKDAVDSQKQLDKKPKEFFKFILDDRLETS